MADKAMVSGQVEAPAEPAEARGSGSTWYVLAALVAIYAYGHLDRADSQPAGRAAQA